MYHPKKNFIITDLFWKYNSLNACENQDIYLFKKICHTRKVKKNRYFFRFFKAFMFQKYSLKI